jgi:hypothetical protein
LLFTRAREYQIARACAMTGVVAKAVVGLTIPLHKRSRPLIRHPLARIAISAFGLQQLSVRVSEKSWTRVHARG